VVQFNGALAFWNKSAQPFFLPNTSTPCLSWNWSVEVTINSGD
jgi:hypothetical protein